MEVLGRFLFLFLCAFISSIDATILGTALPQIAEELNGTSTLTFWCATAFFLAKTVVQPGSPFTKSLIAKYGGAYLKLLVENKSSYRWNLTIYLAFWFQSVRVRTPLRAAIYMIPIILSSSFSSAFAGILVTKLGLQKVIPAN